MPSYSNIGGVQRLNGEPLSNINGVQRGTDFGFVNIDGASREWYNSGRFKQLGSLNEGDIFYLPTASNHAWGYMPWQVIIKELLPYKSPTQPYIVRSDNDIYYLQNLGSLTWDDLVMVQPFRIVGYTSEIFEGTVTQAQSYAQNGVFAALLNLRNFWNLNGVIRGNLQIYGKFGTQLNQWVDLSHGLCPLYASFANLGWYATDSNNRRRRYTGDLNTPPPPHTGGTTNAWWLADFANNGGNVTARITSSNGSLGSAGIVSSTAQRAFIFPIAFIEKSKPVQIQI